MITQQDLERVSQYIAMQGKKDTQLEKASLPLNGEENIAIIQNGSNKKVKLGELREVIGSGINYMTVEAYSTTTSITELLPTIGEEDIIYRVARWDGTRYDISKYSEYAWNDSSYTLLAVNNDYTDDESSKIVGKRYINTQEEFDAIIEHAIGGGEVDVVLAPGTFIVNKCITNLSAPFTLIGSEGTVLKRNNRIYTRSEASVEGNYITFNLGSEPVEPFSIFVDKNNNIIPVSEYAHVNYTEDMFVIVGNDDKGHAITDDNYANVNELTNGYFYIPKGDIDIASAQLPYVFGYVDGAWSADRFVLTGHVTSINTIYDEGKTTQYEKVVEYFEARFQPVSNINNKRKPNSPSNFNLFNNRYSRNQFVLYNTATDGQLYYNNTKLFVPNSFDHVEIIDGWFYYHSYNAADYNHRPQYFIYNITTNCPIYISGIIFRNFQNVLRIYDNVNTAELTGFTIQDCSFDKITANAIITYLSAPQGQYQNKETSYINNCKFTGCGLSGYDSIWAFAQNVAWHGSGKNCIGTGKNWLIVKDCLLDSSIDGIAPYKNAIGMMHVFIDCTIENCVFCNVGRDHLMIDDGEVTVKNCEFYNTDKFNADRIRNIGEDAGAIYINGASNHRKYPVVIEDSIFHDINAVNYYPFLYMDEGRTDVTIQGCVCYNASSSCMNARTTNNAILTFYAWKNNTDVIYTLTNKRFNSHVYLYDETTDTFEDTNVDIEIASSDPLSSITYDNKVWEYDETLNEEPKKRNWSSANIKYLNNVICGQARLVYGKDVQEDMLPVVDGNVFCNNFKSVFGSFAQTQNINPCNENAIYGQNNVVLSDSDYKEDRDVFVSIDVFNSLPDAVKQKVVPIEFPAIKESNMASRAISIIGNTLNGYYHHITFLWKRGTGETSTYNYALTNSFLKINFVSSTINSHGYELILTRYPNIQNFTCSGSNYDFGRVYLWQDPNDELGAEIEHWHIAISMENFLSTYGIGGGFFDVKGSQEVINSVEVKVNEPFINLPIFENYTNNLGVKTASSIVETAHRLDTNNGIQFPFYNNEHLSDWVNHPFSLRRLWSHVAISTCEVIVNNITEDGKISHFGIYRTKGTTLQRPTLTWSDRSFIYFDTDLNKYICWNGSAWINMDGTTLS